MKKMTFEEFQKRLIEVDKARKIFNNLTGDNITNSFMVYQEILASEQMPANISSEQANRTPEVLDDYLKKTCPECGMDMVIRAMVKDEEGKVWPIAWHCPSCFAMYYSEKDFGEIMREAQRDGRWLKK